MSCSTIRKRPAYATEEGMVAQPSAPKEWPQAEAKRQLYLSLVSIAHAFCEGNRDARARVHNPHLILARVVPR